MSRILDDLRWAVRQLRRRPGLTMGAASPLALGIGMTVAMFSLFEATLLRRPDVADPESLVMLYTTCRAGDLRCSSSYPDYLDYRDGARSLSDLAAYSWTQVSIARDEVEPVLTTGQVVTGNYFALLGVAPAAGRLLGPEDGAAPDVVVLSHRLWSSMFGRDPSVVGGGVDVNGSRLRVVGVAPEGFTGVDLGPGPDLWAPMAGGPFIGGTAPAGAATAMMENRGNRWISALVGRLAPGATVEQARADLLLVSDALEQADADGRGGRAVTLDALGTYALPVSAPGELTRLVSVMLGVVALMLLLACANVANLLLVRVEEQGRDAAVRLALGAPSRRLLRQTGIESLLITMLGGVAGLTVAVGSLELLEGFRLPGLITVADLDVRLGGRVLVFALLTSLAVTTLVATGAIVQTSRTAVGTVLRSGAQPGNLRGRRVRQVLVTVQVALCLVLVAGSSLFLRSVARGMEVSGFNADGAAFVRFNPGQSQYNAEQGLDLVRQVRARVAGIPGVEAVGAGTAVPLFPSGFRGTFVTVSGYESAPEEELRVDLVWVTPGYLEALGIPLVRGRTFTPSDGPGSAVVAVISREMADRWWGGRDPLGGRLQGPTQDGTIDVEVVGVVEDVPWRALGEEPTPFVFLVMDQFPAIALSGFVSLVFRGPSVTPELFPMVRDGLGEAGARIPLASASTFNDQLADVLGPQRMGATLLSGFGLLALVLAATGIYGVVSFSVLGRTREIGVRMALGACGARIVRELVGAGMAPVLVGLVIGVATALSAAGLMSSLLFGVAERDPMTLATSTALLGTIGGIACLLPALRAASLDPLVALRAE